MGTPGRAGDNTWVGVHASPYGDLYHEDAAVGLAITGRLFGVHWGTLTTPVATPATQAITTALPQAMLRVPDGTAIIPLLCNITIEAAGATTQGEIAIAICQNDVGNGTSTAGTTQPLSLNTAAPLASNCVSRQLVTSGITAEVNMLELDRQTFAASAVNQKYVWNPRASKVIPLLRGPATFLIYIGGNAVSFFAELQWKEFSETAVQN